LIIESTNYLYCLIFIVVVVVDRVAEFYLCVEFGHVLFHDLFYWRGIYRLVVVDRVVEFYLYVEFYFSVVL
jgi:hypothetical protein